MKTLNVIEMRAVEAGKNLISFDYDKGNKRFSLILDGLGTFFVGFCQHDNNPYAVDELGFIPASAATDIWAKGLSFYVNITDLLKKFVPTKD